MASTASAKKINELTGISATAVVHLNRIGVVTMHDLVNADFDRVAFVLEDYNEATRLVGEAARLTKPKKRHHDDEAATRTHTTGEQTIVPSRPPAHDQHDTEHTSTHTSSQSSAPAARPASPQPASHSTHQPAHQPAHPPAHQAIAARPAPKLAVPKPAPRSDHDNPLVQAFSACVANITLTQSTDPDTRFAVARRFAVADLLTRTGATEHELVAALLIEPIESGSLTPQDALARFGSAIWKIIEQATSLRAVPLLPTGRPPKYYLDMAKSAELPARRLCAAYLIQSLASSRDGVGNLFHARLLLEALQLPGPDPLIDLAAATVDHAASDAASRLAA